MKRAAFIFGVLAVLLAIASTGSAATGKKHEDLIAFVSTSSGTQQLYTVRSDATGLEQLTNDALGVGSPAWSSDGEHLLVLTGCSTVDGNCPNPNGFATMRPDGSDRVDIAGTSPVFSPDGKWLAYLVCSGPYACDLRVAHSNGRSQKLVDTGVSSVFDPEHPAWSSDSKKLVYIKDQTNADSIWQSDRQGHSTLVFEVGVGISSLSPVHSAAFFPNDNTVTFMADFGARIFTIAVGDTEPVDRSFAIGDSGFLVVSPTRTRLAAWAASLGSGGDIEAYTGALDQQGHFIPEMITTSFAHTPVWSPDGARFAYTFCDRNTGFPGEPCSLRVIGPGNSVSTIWNGPAVEGPDWVRGYDWSPDSSQLVMSVSSSGNPFRLNVVNANGSGLEPLLPGSDDQYTPAWRP